MRRQDYTNIPLKDFEKYLTNQGYTAKNCKSSHRKWQKPNCPGIVVVHKHNYILTPCLKQFAAGVNMPMEELIETLNPAYKRKAKKAAKKLKLVTNKSEEVITSKEEEEKSVEVLREFIVQVAVLVETVMDEIVEATDWNSAAEQAQSQVLARQLDAEECRVKAVEEVA